MKKISFLVPIYNKAETIQATFLEISSAAKEAGLEFEIIGIDDGSTDDSYETLRAIAPDFPELRIDRNERNLGFARTYFRCLSFAEGEFVMYVSAENEISKETLRSLFEKIVPGRMVLQTCSNYSERKWFRRVVSRGFTRTMNWVNRVDLGYYNGFNIYPAAQLRELRVFEGSFAFQADIVSRLLKSCSFVEVPIRCGFRDEKSSALRPRNVLGVSRYLFAKVWGRREWTP